MYFQQQLINTKSFMALMGKNTFSKFYFIYCHFYFQEKQLQYINNFNNPNFPDLTQVFKLLLTNSLLAAKYEGGGKTDKHKM